MITVQQVFHGLFGAWRLFLYDRDAIRLFEDSLEGYWKSFSCAAIILPGYTVLIYSTLADFVTTANIVRVTLIEGICYIIGWVAWPLVMAYVAPLLDRHKTYIRYIVAYNWSTLIQVVILLSLLAFQTTGFSSDATFTGVGVACAIILLLYHGFIVRVALDISLKVSAGLVIAELLLGQMIRLATNSLII